MNSSTFVHIGIYYYNYDFIITEMKLIVCLHIFKRYSLPIKLLLRVSILEENPNKRFVMSSFLCYYCFFTMRFFGNDLRFQFSSCVHLVYLEQDSNKRFVLPS